MALKADITLQNGLIAVGAYHRVEKVAVYNKHTINFALCSYTSDGGDLVDHKPMACVFDLSGSNPFVQSYEHLKTLPEFSSAEDV